MNKKLLFFSVLVLVVVFAIYQYKAGNSVDVPVGLLQEKHSVVKLDNGLFVTIKEARALPLVSIQFWVHVGAKNEPLEKKGIAHIFEHIWFKGTETQPVGSFHKRVESLGGELNAMTSHDWTMFYVTVPSDKFDDIFPYMIDLLLHPAFNETEISKEQEVVTEEQRFSFNEPEKYLDDQFGLLLIDNHPYRHPVIGYKDTILSATREEIMDFYSKWYVPNNMNIVIVGDVNEKTVLSKVKNAFSFFNYSALPKLNLSSELPLLENRYNSSFKDTAYNYVAVGFKAPSASDSDRYAMTVLNTIFSIGDSSRLQEIVKKKKNLIVKGNSVFAPLNDFGVFETIAVVEPEKSGSAKAELLLQQNKLKLELVSDE